MICDLHMHIVPGVDDGATDLKMSIEMLRIAYSQGVRNVFCTSHNMYSANEMQRYKNNFASLQTDAKDLFSELNLYTGNEILCTQDYIEEIISQLNDGNILSLNNTRHVLVEFYSDVDSDEANRVVRTLISNNWIPVIAHAERYSLLSLKAIKELISIGALVQINLYSLQEELNSDIKTKARTLIRNQLVHFVGSDAHRVNHRSPKYESGIKYLNEHCNKEYYEDLCFRNVSKILNGDII